MIVAFFLALKQTLFLRNNWFLYDFDRCAGCKQTRLPQHLPKFDILWLQACIYTFTNIIPDLEALKRNILTIKVQFEW